MASNTSKHPIDQAAFQNLYNLYGERLPGSVTGMVRDKNRAEDITAAAFQIAWEKRVQFRGKSSLYTWLYAIASNEARRAWRRDRPERIESIDQLPQLAEPDRASEALERSEYRQLVRKELNRIPAKCRRVLVAHFLNGHSIQAIARRTNIPCGTVLSRMFTAKRLLRQAWKEVT